MSDTSLAVKAVAGAAVVGLTGLILLAPHKLPRVDFITPWRSGQAMQTLDPNKKYLCYATAAALPGNPWLSLVWTSESSKKFETFGKEIFKQIEASSGLIGHFRVARPLKNEYIWVTAWESKEGLNEFFKSGAHKEAMASYRQALGADSGAAASSAPFNVKFICTGDEIERLSSSYKQLTQYWCTVRDTIASNLKGGLLRA